MDSPDPKARAEALNYKLRKEAFVSNLSGSSLADINLVTLVAASAILLWTVLARRGFLQSSDSATLYVIDFLLNVCAILFAFTVYASFPIFLNIALIVPSILLLLPLGTGTRSPRKSTKNETTSTQKKHDPSSTSSEVLSPGKLIVRPFLTNYRGAMLIATALAILAVDFHAFPRRFAKVETWGTSLMDLGVGSFVFSAGVVSARTVIREGQASKQQSNSAAKLLGSFRHSLPLIVLGIIRLISVKNLDYAEHVTEYGVHWNFFFTLALLPPFVETVDACLGLIRKASSNTKSTAKSIRYDVVAISISTVYEVVLNSTGLLAFILVAPRTPESDLITKNREGIFSFFGYLAVFLAGRSTGILVCQFQSYQTTPNGTGKKTQSATSTESESVFLERRKVILPQLLARATVYSVQYFLTTSIFAANLTVSRRLANLPYVLWICAFNNAQLFLFAIIEAFGPRFVFSKTGSGSQSQGSETTISALDAASPIMRAFNSNGLALFLLANLGTGVVNMTMNTLDTGNAQAMGVLVVYAGVLSCVAIALDAFKIKIKI